MCFSIVKTVLDKYTISVDKKDIELVSKMKYLGVTLDQHLKLNIDMRNLLKPIKNSLTALKQFKTK